MNILQKTLTLDKTELIELLEIVKKGKNKNNRWNSFSNSNVKKVLEDNSTSITRVEFLKSGGLESITRNFIYDNQDDFTEKLKDFKISIHEGIKFYVGDQSSYKKSDNVILDNVKTTSFSDKLIECSDCGKKISKKASMCPGCGNPNSNQSTKTTNKPEVKLKKKNITGNWCPKCGNRNSVKSSDGGGCLILGILFISIIGILLIPFLPKNWKCKSCGNEWK